MLGLPALYDPATTDPATRRRQPFEGNIIPASRLDPIATALLNYIPEPNSPGDRYIITTAQKLTENQYNFRTDYKATEKDSFFFRFTQDHRTQENPGPFGTIVGGKQDDVLSINGVLSYTRLFSPTKINEFRFSANRINLNFDTLSKGLNVIDELGIGGLEARKVESIEGFPILGVVGYPNFGDGPSLPLQQRFNTFYWVDTFTWIKGNHSVKVGADVRRYQRAAFNGINARGSYSFTGTLTQNPQSPGGTGSALADFLLGLPNTAARNHPRLRQRLFWTNVSSFVQDDWKITRKLTLNLGVRHEFNGQPLEKQDRIGSFDLMSGRPVAASAEDGTIDDDALIFFTQPELDFLGVTVAKDLGFPRRTLRENHYRSFAPRIGFAYSPFHSAKTVIRGGYGIFYTLPNGGPQVGPSVSVPFYRAETFTTDPLVPSLTLRNGFPASTAVPVPDIMADQKDWNGPYIQEWSFTLQQQLDQSTVVELGYVASKATHLEMRYQLNQPPPGPGAIQARRPHPKFSLIQSTATVGYGNYNALQIRAERRFSRGFTFLAAYTLSKAITNVHGDVGILSNTQNPADLKDTKGLSDFDIPQRFVLSTVWELPFGGGRRWLNQTGVWNALLGGWQLGNILTLRSGLPFTPTTGRDIANVGATTRPNRVGTGAVSNPTLDRWFDVTAFTNPAAFTLWQ